MKKRHAKISFPAPPEEIRDAIEAARKKRQPNLLSLVARDSPKGAPTRLSGLIALESPAPHPSPDVAFTLPLFTLAIPKASTVNVAPSPFPERPLREQAVSEGWVSFMEPTLSSAGRSTLAFITVDGANKHHLSHLLQGWLPRALANALKAVPEWRTSQVVGSETLQIAMLRVPILRYDFLWSRMKKPGSDLLVRLIPPIRSKTVVRKPMTESEVIAALNDAWPDLDTVANIPRKTSTPSLPFRLQ
jgi:hypothetical protein